MIAVSDRWKQLQHELLVPEAFIELSIGVTEDGLQEEAVVSSTNKATFSSTENVVDIYNEHKKRLWATNELNLWSLDGLRNIITEQASAGYVSNTLESGVVEVSFSEVHTQALQGVTITWCEEYGEYATNFTITAYNGSSVVASTTVDNNTSVVSRVEMDIADYDKIKITVNEWSLPQHRVRIERVQLGVNVLYLKNDIMRYKHTQSGDAFSGELPKNSIEFSLENSDGRWNPNNPVGQERYLSERQEIKVRYGFNIDGTIEWIKAGTFYLSEWRTPSNGIEATFVARDLLEYMVSVDYTGRTSGTLYQICEDAIASANLPTQAVVYLDERLKNYSATIEDEYTVAEVLQLCANAGCCVMYQNRDGEFRIEYVNNAMVDYRIDSDVQYSYPEFELSKPLKSVSVTYGNENEKYLHTVSDEGEIQSLSNPFISDEAQAEEVAQWVENTLKFRKSINGEYRADPRLDLFDRVAVESKYAVNNAVLITNLVYTYSGVFKGSFEGLISEFAPVMAAYCGEIYVGEV